MKKRFIRSLSILTLVAVNLVAVQPAVFAATTSAASVQAESATTLAQPAVFKIANASGLMKEFEWSKVEGAVSYKIYAEKISLANPASKTTVELNKRDVDNGTIYVAADVEFEAGYGYNVYIVAVDANGNTSAPKYYSEPLIYDGGGTTLAVPSVFKITNASGLTKEFAWSDVEGATSYNLFAEKTSTATGITTLVELNKSYLAYNPTIYNVASVNFEVGYTYKVFIVAADANGNHSNTLYYGSTIDDYR